MNLRLQSSALLLCLGIGLVAPAQAVEPGWYVVGFGGQTSSSMSQSQMDGNLVTIFESIGLDATNVASTVDDSGTGFGLAGGYQINKNFAVEFAYVDLGSVDYQASATVTDGVDVANADVEFESSADGAVVSVLGILPIGERFSVFGRAGLSLMNAKGTARIAFDDISENASQSEQKSDPMFGVGADFNLSKYFAIRLAWDRYLDVGTEDVTGDVDADLISLGFCMGLGWWE